MRNLLTHRILCFVLLLGLPGLPAVAAELPEARADKGLVVFYRTKRATGAAIRMQITTSDRTAGTLSNGKMFYQYYDPGQRTFDVSTPSVAGSDLITLNLEAGQTYFVRGEILLGWPAGRPRLTQESESRASQDISKL